MSDGRLEELQKAKQQALNAYQVDKDKDIRKVMRTIDKLIKERIKENVGEDFEDYLNNDLELIK